MWLRLSIVLSALLISHSVLAFNLTGEGYGVTRDDAKKQALAALSEALQVEVKSETDIYNSNITGTKASNRIQTLSELPLLGVDFTFINKTNEYFCTGYLDSNKSSRLYQEKIALLVGSLNAMYKNLTKSAGSNRYQLLSDILSKLDQYEKYQLVARLLGVQHSTTLPMTVSQIKGEMLSIEAAVPSLDLAAKLLTRDLINERMFVFAAMPQGSQEVTELSRVLRDKIMSQVKTYAEHKQASYVMKGHYEIHDKGISVTYRLIGDFGETQATRVVKLAPAAYQGIAYQSKSIDFGKLLHEGYVVSNQFHAELNTNRGKSDLLFTEGEEVEIFARVNSPGFFYIVAHNSTDNSSYLMELSEANDKRKFVKYVNADQANRWISLGAFEVGAPYGVEYLQLIASNEDIIDQLPATVYSTKNELYMLGEKFIEDAVVKTRGLKKKKNNENQVITSEATMTITTMVK